MHNKNELTAAIYHTIGNLDGWKDVLRMLCENTGAIRASITLREVENAEIVVSELAASQLAAHPLLWGWQAGEIDSYILKYLQHDSWFAVAQAHHPVQPFAVSRYLDLDDVKQTPFWEWLQLVGISDTVICDIGPSPHTWMALNLFFDAQQTAVRDACIHTLSEFQGLMQHAWSLGMKLRFADTEHDYFESLLQLQNGPALVLDSEQRMLSANAAARALLADNPHQLALQDGRLWLAGQPLLSRLQHGGQLPPVDDALGARQEHQLADYQLQLTLRPLDKPDDATGDQRGLQLLLLRPLGAGLLLEPVWEVDGLTRREKELVEFLAKGGKVADFAREHGLKKETGHFHWQNVKKKLKLTDRAEIVARHQVYLANL